MNLLVIGNGFDLAHGLPTEYRDYLNFTRAFNVLFSNIDYDGPHKDLTDIQIHPFVEKYLDHLWNRYNDLKDKYDVIYDVVLKDGQVIPDSKSIKISKSKRTLNKSDIKVISTVEAFKTLLYRNYWLIYFYDVVLERNWVDFETELSEIGGLLEKLTENNDIELSEKKKKYIDIHSEIGNLFYTYFYAGQMANLTLKSVIDRYQVVDESKSIPGKHGTLTVKSYIIFCVKDLYDIRRILQTSLEYLTFAFELYLSEVVDKIGLKKVKPQLLFKDINVNRVLSFNYTHTWQRLYGFTNTDSKVEYVHGEVSTDPVYHKCKLVLGMNEALESSKTDNISMLKFKKYYQRIRKNTGREYKEWINALDIENKINEKELSINIPDSENPIISTDIGISSNTLAGYGAKMVAEIVKSVMVDYLSKMGTGDTKLPSMISKRVSEAYDNIQHYIDNVSCVYVFGHSLDITDKDVLKRLMDYDWIKVVVFYRSEEDLDKKIENLIRIIGREKLIERRGGKRQTIFFKNISTGVVI